MRSVASKAQLRRSNPCAPRTFRSFDRRELAPQTTDERLWKVESGYSFLVIPKRDPSPRGDPRDRDFGPRGSLGAAHRTNPTGLGPRAAVPLDADAVSRATSGPELLAERTARDLDLRDRIASGEIGAAESLLGEHLDSLFEFVHYRIGRDRSRVEDVVQETFLVALRDIQSFDGRSSLHTWLCGIAKNKIRSERRKRAPMSLEDALANSDSEIDAILSEVSREPLPDAVLEKQETRDLVGATLSSLSPDYRRALIEKYVEGRSTAEIAGRVGKSEKAAESTLTRARVAFARVFELLAKKRGGLG